ncbi:ubiquitin carboxyl-terminal hydrolase 5/13, partial [Tremellales sp. Uapishka_1]
MSCEHLKDIAGSLQPPATFQQVHREECTLCSDGQDDPEGVLVCLTCYNGGCFGQGREHAQLHYQKTRHPLGVVVKRTRKEAKRRDSSEPPLKKLAITAPSDDELYSYSTSLRCFTCSKSGEAIHSEDPKVTAVVAGIMSALSSAQQSEVKAWEEEILACEHTLTLQQEPVISIGHVPSQCSSCDLTSNLWLCLTCGLANCGRQQFGGTGGNGHALHHFQETGHGLGVKLGTVTPEGTADVYCYSCDDAKVDPDLPAHLRAFGIEVLGQTKTEKSMTELQLEHNLKFDFSMTGDDGKELEPIFGAGLTGLKNLGNSCYMASVMQTLFSLPSFRARYYSEPALTHIHQCDNPLPATCLECQMLKFADGLLSSRYSHPSTFVSPEGEQSKFQEGIKPSQFKALIGKGHEEFATMRQQDSEEFLQHLLDRLRREAKRLGRAEEDEATNVVRFGMEQRLECRDCRRVGYKVDQADLASLPVEAVELGVDDGGKRSYQEVELTSCLQALCATEELADYSCGHCGTKVTAEKSTRFKTFPELLVLHMKKFQLVNWMPTKLEIPVVVPDILELDAFLGQGRQEGELELDSELEPSASSLPDFNEAALSELVSMGFPLVRCQKALLATGNADAESATNWLFEHMDDMDIDEPLASGGARPAAAAGNVWSEGQISGLVDMGFTPAQARKALGVASGNMEGAVDWLFSHPDDQGEAEPLPAATTGTAEPEVGGTTALPAKYRLKAFISHKGPSVHSGHYVATIRQPQQSMGADEWVLFNDEKVVRAPENGGDEMRSKAYLYVYEKV